jgi:hypothetical protein
VVQYVNENSVLYDTLFRFRGLDGTPLRRVEGAGGSSHPKFSLSRAAALEAFTRTAEAVSVPELARFADGEARVQLLLSGNREPMSSPLSRSLNQAGCFIAKLAVHEAKEGLPYLHRKLETHLPLRRATIYKGSR